MNHPKNECPVAAGHIEQPNQSTDAINFIAPAEYLQSKLNAAVELLRQPIQDRHRSLHSFVDSILLVDDSGGGCIEYFDDATACHYFIVWLHERRAANEKQRAVERNRATFKLVQGGQSC